MPKAHQIREAITQRIADALKNNVAVWSRPWSADPNCGAPTNIISKNTYRGINPLLLQLTSSEKGFVSRYWGTYRQWLGLGGQVRRGEKGTSVVFYTVIEKETEDDPFYLLRQYSIFNIEQVDGDKLDAYRPMPDAQDVLPDDIYSIADNAIRTTGADIRFGGNQPFYTLPTGPDWPEHTGGDFIRCPHRRQFPDIRNWYSTLFHELAHWSQVRLGWSGSYAMGELIAEMTACYLSNELRLPQSEEQGNHEAYLQSWLQAMENDPKWIFKAAKQADKATDFILSFSQVAGVEQTEAA
jgi:antirestriction protein ArdC